jgi:hypothetical protein
MNKETLLTSEPRLAQLFQNSKQNHRLANAYLLYGPRNAPLKETALFLAKSVNCSDSLLACDKCLSCQKFNDGIRPDFVIIDGSDETIQKEDIQNLIDRFSMSALEKGHNLVYVINEIESITDKASNALLKFLEEPKEGQIAFLTTHNLTKVLPTIRSRSITFRIDPINPGQLFTSLIDFEYVEGKKKVKLSEGEAFVLSRLCPSKEDASYLLTVDDSFQTGYEVAEAFLNDLATDLKSASFTLLRQNSLIKDPKCYNWLYLTIDLIFTCALVNDISDNNPFKEVIHAYQKNLDAIQRGENIIKKAIALKQLNLNPTLISAELFTALDEEK